VVTVHPFDTEVCRIGMLVVLRCLAAFPAFSLQDEVIGYVNAVRYGLAGSVWTNDLTQAHRCDLSVSLLIVCLMGQCRVVLWDQSVRQDRQRSAVGELLAVP
jgi:Aldehyde dehydrogenase family